MIEFSFRKLCPRAEGRSVGILSSGEAQSK